MRKIIRVAVVGGGFAGISAVRRLAAASSRFELSLVDPRPDSVFLPLLPDVVSGRIRPGRLLFPLAPFCRKLGIDFIRRRAAGIEGEDRLLLDDGSRLDFDYLLLCAGGRPRLPGEGSISRIARTLYGIGDAEALAARAAAAAAGPEPHNFVVVGGGYTGFETATALAYRFRRRDSRAGPISIRIVEAGPAVLGGLPENIAAPVRREAERMGIEVLVSSGVGEVREEWVEVGGERIGDFTLVWSAGVETVDFIQKIESPRDRQGRLEVEPELRLPGKERIFAAGDAASFSSNGKSVRMAIQFSLSQGAHAARNIIRGTEGKPAVAWRPCDLGYLVPLSSGKAWGVALGRRVGGRLGSFLHYFMCVARSFSFSNRSGIVRDLMFG